MEQQEKSAKKQKTLSKKSVLIYAISFFAILVLTLFVNIVYIKHMGAGGTKIYALNLKKLTDLKRQEIHKEILRHPTSTTPKMIKEQITDFVKDIDLDTKVYESDGVIIVKQAVIGGKGYEDITGKIESRLKKQKVL